MARTTLRGRSGDIVTTLHVADRTGILAASAPPRAVEPKPESPSTLLVANQVERPVARHGRRNLVFAFAAALFLVVGWIGGGVFGQRGDDTPVMAVGAALGQEQGGTIPDAGTPEPPAAPVTTPATVPPAPTVTSQSAANAKSSASKSKRTTKSVTPEAPASDAPAVDETAGTSAAAPTVPPEVAGVADELLDAFHGLPRDADEQGGMSRARR